MCNFTARLNPDCDSEYQIFKDGSIFCHLHESDFDFFVANFKYPVIIELVSTIGDN